jgi:FHA domain
MIKCSECGYENIDGLDYCDGCGAKLTAAAAAALAGESGGAAASEPAAQPAPVAAAEEAPAAPPPSEAPTGEIKPPPEADAVAAAAAPAAEAPAAEAPAAAAVSSARAKLQVVRGGRKGQEFPLEDGNNLVGRWDPETGAFPEVDLDQDDPEAKISRKHALIRFEAGKITVEDIGSLNGTYVNRQPRLMPGNPVELKSGDEIIIGKTFLKLVVDPVS